MNSIKSNVASGLVWKFSERILAQGVSFLLSLILARLLMPEEYGTVALVLVFINLANIFITSGLGDSLIQKKESDEEDFSTMFFCGLIMSLVIYAIMFVSASGIAAFYNNPALIRIIRVLSLQIPLGSVKTIQHAYVIKKMLFKKFFFSTLGGTLFSGILGIILAYKGAGVWAIVFQYLANSFVDMIVLFFTIEWRPQLCFKKETAKVLFSYGWKLTVAQFLNTAYVNIRNLFIGKLYTEADLAYYNKGDQFPNLIINNVNNSISTVLFPAMASENDNISRLKSITRRSMTLSSYIIFPIMIGLIVVSEPLIRILLTDKWLSCTPYLCISCVYWMFQPCQTANVQVIKALGKSGLYLKLEMIKKFLGIILLIGSLRFGVFAIAFSNVILAFLSAIINIFPNKHLIGYGYGEQICDLSSALFMTLIMGGFVYIEKFVISSDLVLLLFQIFSGILIYIILSVALKDDSFDYLRRFLLERIKSRRK